MIERGNEEWLRRSWKGIATDRGNINRQIEIDNKALRQLRARINKLKDWLKKETETPTLAEVVQSILSGREYKYQWQKTADLKTASTILNFLTANSITDIEGLRKKVEARVAITVVRDTLRLSAISLRLKPRFCNRKISL